MTFEDRTGGVALAPGGIKFGFDLTDAVDKELLGKELYSAEKRWFLEQTAAFRDELARAHRAETFERAALRLRGKLTIILEDAARSPAEKRAAVFALWDDCADDEIGRSAQAIVEAFVRERMPPGSVLGYDQRELDRLNTVRVSPRKFDPYAARAAGVSRPG